MVGDLSRPASYKTMLSRSCLGAMLVGLAIDEVDSSLCYELSRPILSRPLSYETLVLLLLAVTCGDSSTMSQAKVPLERIHVFYRKWVRSVFTTITQVNEYIHHHHIHEFVYSYCSIANEVKGYLSMNTCTN